MLTTHSRLPDLYATIVALSSAPGPAGRAIVRLSGGRAFAIAGALTPDFDGARVVPGRFTSVRLRLPGFAAGIDADLYAFAAPRTYTGQDVVEIHLLSCQPIVDEVIAQCLNAGARAARPGEFTLRAFLAGKLDLTRAEAVLGVIEATRRDDLHDALTQLAGGMAQPLRLVREDLLNLLADVEAGLDFADEDLSFVASDDLLKRLGIALAHLTILKKQLDRRTLGQRAFRVVLAGKPNAGKSSLFNALAGRGAALVSPEPGTTRDYLEATIDIGGIAIELVDTAGLGESACTIDAAAQDLGARQAQNADLVLWCSDCGEAPPAAISDELLLVATKSDAHAPTPGMLATSAATGAGLDDLRARLADAVRRAGHAALAPSVSRCRHHVDACLAHLQHAHANVIDAGMPEILALELRLAIEEMGAMVGMIYTDDLLDRIFSRFCIGK